MYNYTAKGKAGQNATLFSFLTLFVAHFYLQLLISQSHKNSFSPFSAFSTFSF